MTNNENNKKCKGKTWENHENHIKKSDNESVRKNRKLREIKNRYEDIIKILQIRGISPTKDNILFFIKSRVCSLLIDAFKF